MLMSKKGNNEVSKDSPIESLQTCTSMALKRHQRAFIRLWSRLTTTLIAWQKLLDFVGYVITTG